MWSWKVLENGESWRNMKLVVATQCHVLTPYYPPHLKPFGETESLTESFCSFRWRSNCTFQPSPCQKRAGKQPSVGSNEQHENHAKKVLLVISVSRFAMKAKEVNKVHRRRQCAGGGWHFSGSVHAPDICQIFSNEIINHIESEM